MSTLYLERFYKHIARNIPFRWIKRWNVICANKMPCFACCFEVSSGWKPENTQIQYLKYAKLLTCLYEWCMLSFDTSFQLELEAADYGYWMCRYTKHLEYPAFWHAFIASYNFLAKCIWIMKSREVTLMHLCKKALEYWGMIPSPSVPLMLLQSGRHHYNGSSNACIKRQVDHPPSSVLVVSPHDF